MSTSQPFMDKKGIRNSVWNFNNESERESKTITLDEYMDFMRKFLNRLYPPTGLSGHCHDLHEGRDFHEKRNRNGPT